MDDQGGDEGDVHEGEADKENTANGSARSGFEALHNAALAVQEKPKPSQYTKLTTTSKGTRPSFVTPSLLCL